VETEGVLYTDPELDVDVPLIVRGVLVDPERLEIEEEE